MKRAVSTAIILSLALAVPAFAVQSGQRPNPPGTFEQRQANVLKMLDERITMLQQDKACVQAAKNDEDLMACREKHRAEMQDRRGAMRRPGMQGGVPGGQQ